VSRRPGLRRFSLKLGNQVLHYYALLIIALCSWPIPALSCGQPYQMKLILDLNTADMDSVVSALKETPVNTVTTSIAWSVVEPIPGKYSFEPYVKAFDRLTQEGYCLNVILDTSGRLLLGNNRQPQTDVKAVPNWLAQQIHKMPFAKDFYGNNTASMLSVADIAHLPYLQKFYEESLAFLARSYRDKVAFVAPGVSSELEIKYTQSGYRFEDYSPETQQLFRKFMTATGKPEVDLPVIDYQSFFTGGAPKPHPYRDDLQEFRKDMLVRYYCARTATIRSSGFKAFGYFGGPFQLHDMIYGSGVIEKAPKCFDGIAIDHNFYDGHKIDTRPTYVSTIVNYATNLGFKEVIVGLYTERLGLAGMGASAVHDVLTAALKSVTPDRAIVGVEIGGFEITDPSARVVFAQDITKLIREVSHKPEPRKYTIAVLGSFTTFELWQGEYYFNRSIHQDALQDAVKMLETNPDITVRVISEDEFQKQAFSADAIYLPHVTAPTEQTVKAVNELIALGKPFIQDVRFAEFRPDGSPNPDYPLQAFGIASSQWMTQGGSFAYNSNSIQLPDKRSDFYASHLQMTARKGYFVAVPENNQTGGIFIRGPNTLALGIVPQFMGPEWQAVTLKEITKLIDDERR
jgi:hypothetical protein